MKIPDRLFENALVVLVISSTLLFFMLGFGVIKQEGGFDLKRHLNEAVFYMEENNERQECVWNAERVLWSCSEMDWNTVGQTQVILNGEPIQCIWAHPRNDRVIHVEYPKTLTGSRLDVKAMLADSAISCTDDSPVKLDVLINGKTEMTLEVTKNKKTETGGMRLTENKSKIEFRIKTENETCKHFCFDAYVS
jgi:hypothetical protein